MQAYIHIYTPHKYTKMKETTYRQKKNKTHWGKTKKENISRLCEINTKIKRWARVYHGNINQQKLRHNFITK